MSKLTIPFTKPWDIKLPAVIRYLENRHIDQFYSDGILRLSSFKKFRQHPDEARGDKQEGFQSIQLNHADGGSSASIMVDESPTYILSTCLIEDMTIMKALNAGYESGIKITDTVQFAMAVAHHLPGFVGGVQGNCLYRDNTVVSRENVTPIPFNPPNAATHDENEKLMAAEVKKIQSMYREQDNMESYFVKHKRFSGQIEYRFVWGSSLAMPECGHLDIKLPEEIIRATSRVSF